MLLDGIWYQDGGYTKQEDGRNCRRQYNLVRSENEPEYVAALAALLAIHADNNHFMAVVSLRWCSATHRFVKTKRFWLGIYYADLEVLKYSHTNPGSQYRALRNFADSWDDVSTDQAVWEHRFNEAIRAATRW